MRDKEILLILTGGTICSFGDEKNEKRDLNITKARRLLLSNFQNSNSLYRMCNFDVKMILDVLSENMTINKWNQLLSFLKKVNFNLYKGVIIAHGTDTLAYTACLLALALSGITIPVFIVSSNLPLNDKLANGNDNFRIAVELICTEMLPGVYVPYRNDDNIVYLHKGCNITQAGNYSQNFYSRDAQVLQESISIPTEWYKVNNPINIQDIACLKNDVIYLKPYVGLNYDWVKIDADIRVVVHGLYHSETACVEAEKEDKDNSILTLLKRCNAYNIPVIIEPSSQEQNIYITNSKMVESGAIPIYGMTSEMVYVKAIVAGALKAYQNNFLEFLKKDICGEIIS